MEINLLKDRVEVVDNFNNNIRALSFKANNKKDNYKIITFDIETWGLNPNNLALGIFYDEETKKYSIHYSYESIFNYIDNLENNTLIYAHNGFNYDYIFLIEKVLERKVSYRKFGNVGIMKYTNSKNTRIEFKDSLYLLQGSLDSLGKSFKLNEFKGTTPTKFINPKEVKFNVKKYEENIEKYNREKITKKDIDYCKQDCLVLSKILHSKELMDLGFKNYNTIANIANRSLLSYLENKGKVIQIYPKYDNFFKDVYSGGLCDVFINEAINKPIETYDFNSMYPYAMTQDFANPINLEIFDSKYEDIKEDFFDMLQNYPNGCSIINLKLKDNTPNEIIEILKRIPLFPIEKSKYLDIFDGNTYKIKIMNKELSNALNENLQGCIEIEPLYSLHCRKRYLEYSFKEWIEENYNKRLLNKKENPSLAEVLKRTMNSSYGYFAMQNEERIDFIGNKEKVSNEIFMYLKSKNIEVDTFKIFVEKNRHLTFNEELNEYEVEESIDSLKSYLNYLDEVVGDVEDFKVSFVNKFYAMEIETRIEDFYYIVGIKGSKHIEASKTCFYYASEITSKSRALLGKVALEVAFSNNNVCYVDTDSLHIQVNDKEKLDKALEKYLDDNKLGMLKHEGTFQKGVWLAKKHYYLFLEKDKKFIFSKKALKGFRNSLNLDFFVEVRNILNVDKFYTKLKTISFKPVTITSNKNFMNFVVSRNIDGTFFKPNLNDYYKILEENQKIDKDINKNLYLNDEIARKNVQEIFYRMIDSNIYVTKNKNDYKEVKELENEELIKVSTSNIKRRKKELNKEIESYIELKIIDCYSINKIKDSTTNMIKKRFIIDKDYLEEKNKKVVDQLEVENRKKNKYKKLKDKGYFKDYYNENKEEILLKKREKKREKKQKEKEELKALLESF